MNIEKLQDTIKRLNYVLLEIEKEQQPFKGLSFYSTMDKKVLGILALNGNYVTQTSLPFEAVAKDLQKIEQARKSIRRTLWDYHARLKTKVDAVNELLKED